LAIDLQKRQINQVPQQEFRNFNFNDRQQPEPVPAASASQVHDVASDVLTLFGYDKKSFSNTFSNSSTAQNNNFFIQPTIFEEQNQDSTSFSSVELPSPINYKTRTPSPPPFRHQQTSGSSNFQKLRSPSPERKSKPKSPSSSSKSSKSSKHSHGKYEVYEGVVYNVSPSYNNYSSNFCHQPINYYPQHLNTHCGQTQQMSYYPQQQMGFYPQQTHMNHYQPQMQMGYYQQQPMQMNCFQQQFYRPNYC
jgi:hypothetical protein